MLALRDGWPRPFTDYAPGDPFAVREFSEKLRVLISEDWVHCKIVGTREVPKFEAHGGALNLSEMIEVFRRWVQA